MIHKTLLTLSVIAAALVALMWVRSRFAADVVVYGSPSLVAAAITDMGSLAMHVVTGSCGAVYAYDGATETVFGRGLHYLRRPQIMHVQPGPSAAPELAMSVAEDWAKDEFAYEVHDLPGATPPAMTRHTVRFPLWFAIGLALVYPLWSGIFLATLRHTRRQRGLCVRCAFSLRGNESGVCPECGTAIAVPPRWYRIR